MGEHLHPSIVERFTPLEGELTLKRNGKTSILPCGETAVIEPGVWHDWWNATDRDIRVRVEVTPGERFMHMIETFFGLARLGHTTSKGMPYPLQIALCARVRGRDCLPRTAAPGPARNFWHTRTHRTLARLSRNLSAAFPCNAWLRGLTLRDMDCRAGGVVQIANEISNSHMNHT